MSPSMSGDVALPVSVKSLPTENEPVPLPLPAPEEGHEGPQAQAQAQALVQDRVQAQSLSSASAPSRMAVLTPDGVKHPAVRDAPTAGVLSTPTTPVPSFENYVTPDLNDKKAQGPVPVHINVAVPRRSNGHSLLTQQLAEARGVAPPATGQSTDAPHPSPRLQHFQYDPSIGSRPKRDPSSQTGSDTRSQTTTDKPEPHDENDEDLLTPRASPRAIAMATTSTVSAMSLHPPRATDTILSRTFDTSDLGDVETRIKIHRELLGSVGKGMSSESTDREHRLKELAVSTRTYSDTSVPPNAATSRTLNQLSPQTNGRLNPGSAAEATSPGRPRKPDHRVSAGPEKVWSIGSEDLSNAQDGQVEKSIAEVLAGVEPNARSRKASHSLRFFKEGLPEEKLKRRESRLALKDKVSMITDDALHNGNPRGDDPARSLQLSPRPAGDMPGRLTRTKTFPAPETGTPHDDAEPVDYFKVHPDNTRLREASSPFEPDIPSPEPPENLDETMLTRGGGGQDTISDDAVEDGTGEDGELSGEEKISSAVFVPHKGLQDVPEQSDESETDVDAAVKSYSKSEEASSWLVKADEPEADEPGSPDGPTNDHPVEATHHRREAEQPVKESEPSSRAAPVLSSTNEQDHAAQDGHNHIDLTTPGHDDHVHDHPQAPEQPLDAIELVPYRHQVGGHTTVWRFSKKAVCKQLNNRENEFYEQIERHHPDLLPFLPRYAPFLAYVSSFATGRHINMSLGTLVFLT